MKRMISFLVVQVLYLALVPVPAAAQNKTAIGGLIGASVGNQIGCRADNCSQKSRAIGTGIGALAGAIVGRSLDKRAATEAKTPGDWREPEAKPDEGPKTRVKGADGREIEIPSTSSNGIIGPPNTSGVCSGQPVSIRQRDVDASPLMTVLATGLRNHGWCYTTGNSPTPYFFDLVVREEANSWGSNYSIATWTPVVSGHGSIKSRSRYLVAINFYQSDGMPLPDSSAAIHVGMATYQDNYTWWGVVNYWNYSVGLYNLVNPLQEVARYGIQVMTTRMPAQKSS